MLSGYDITQELYSGSRTLVYQGIRQSDQLPVVIKLLKIAYPSFNELVQFRNQYTIAKNLNIPGVVRPYSLEPHGNGYALVMPDSGGISLQHYAQQNSLALTDILAIAIQLADILHELAQQRIVHKDIKPANILIQPESKQIQLIDFSIASLLPKETQEIQSPNGLEGTLAYLAPEQTGRMNRGIDYRTDFYAFGVTLYHLLSGTLPFTATDPLELIHCHIAKAPVPLDQVNVAIPQMVAAIATKLMAKNAEDRYQSAMGLKYDLQRCLTQWKETGEILAFQLGERDLSDRFLIPEKLYGRDTEVQALLDAFDRVSHGNSELMLVAGFSGIGKTAVVNEVHKPIIRQRGYFIKGKYDQFNRNIPLSAFVQALRDLMAQLLSESDAQLQTWKAKILTAVGENGQVIVDVIPELERILGQQPSVPELSGSAVQNRFNLLFQKFIQVFTTPDHPLVIFLDDLQWADSASIDLLVLLTSAASTGYLLILAAYRDNEVYPAHPLMLALQQIAKTQAISPREHCVNVQTITLSPLKEQTVNCLMVDTLSCNEHLAFPLTQLVYQKTQGNPFFTTQFLKALHEEGWIQFQPDLGYWYCDITAVRQLALTDDVVEFMAVQLQKLPGETQQALKLAACIGNQFDLNTLAIVSEQSQTEIATALWKALQEGLILPLNESYKFFQSNDQWQMSWSTHCTDTPTLKNNNPNHRNPNYSNNDTDDRTCLNEITVVYKFLHDRVQQAAYSLIAEDHKATTHWKIGQLLLQSLLPQQQEAKTFDKISDKISDKIFDVVNQLNLGTVAIANPTHYLQLAQLNLQAGEKAKLSAAYRAAQTYCETGMALLPTTAWQTDYALSYALHRQGAEAAYLCGNFDQAEALYSTTLAQAQTALDKAVIYRVQMTQYQLQGRNAEAIAIQRQSLQLLGWSMPVDPESCQHHLDAEIATVDRFLEQQTVASILDFAKMENDTIAEMLRILQILFYAAWLDGQPTLALLALAKMTTLSLQYGNSDMSPFGYVGYGLIANALLKNAAQAYAFGSMAVQLCEQFDNADVRGMTNFLFAADVQSWKRPLREADPYYENAFKYGMDAGNWLTVGFMMMLSGSDRLTYGKNLDELYTLAQTHATFLRQIKSLENLDALIVGVLQPVRHLLGLTNPPFSFDDDSFSEAEYLQKYSNAPYHLAWFYSVKIRHAYLFAQQDLYPALIPHLSMIEETIASHAKVPSSVFYVILMYLALIETTSDVAQSQDYWQAIEPLEARLDRWEQDCPENIRHKCLLIQAEKARLQGQTAAAIDLYEQAIAQAQAQAYDYEAALANELAAKFYLNWGKEKVAAGYLQEAYYSYAQWGAKAKIEDLEQRYPALLQPILQSSSQTLQTLNVLQTLDSIATPSIRQQTVTQSPASSSTNINIALDFAAVLKASQSISSTMQLDELLSQLAQAILQHSGAERFVMVVPDRTEAWQVQIIATPEQINIQTMPLENSLEVPLKLIQYVKNTQEAVVIDNLETDLPVIDEYLLERQPKSLLCFPVFYQGQLRSIVYFKNRSTTGVFTIDRIHMLNFLCTQATISLENARLYAHVQQQQHRLAALLSNLPGMAYSCKNDANWEMQFVSEGCLELTGYPPEALLHNHQIAFADCIHPDDRALVDQTIQSALAQQTAFQITYRIQTQQGTEKWVWERGRGVFNGNDEWISLEGLIVDISDRKASETLVLQKSHALEQALTELQNAQLQMVQSEKMASLGNLIAGIAHEINNPIGFLTGSIKNAKDYVQDLLHHLALYQQHHPNAAIALQHHAAAIDLAFLTEDLPQLLHSMQGATDRIKGISTSLRTFSRADTEHKTSAHLHEGIDSTLLILKYRLKANEYRPAIEVIQNYGDLPPIDCFPGQLNQVFMNILANAIDMFDEMAQSQSFHELEAQPQRIKIWTAIVDNQVQIRIQDNGKGMTEAVQAKIFDHLFTTKGVGKGTGLGLAIARQIVEEKHQGNIRCLSQVGQGTEFIIELPIE